MLIETLIRGYDMAENGVDDVEDNNDISAETLHEELAKVISESIKQHEEMFPSEVIVLPVFGTPFLPTQIMPVQVGPSWEDTLRRAVDSPEKMIALAAVPEHTPIDQIIQHLDHTACLIRLVQVRFGDEMQFIAQGLTRVNLHSPHMDKHNVIMAKATYPLCELPPVETTAGKKVSALAVELVATVKELLPLNPLYFEELKHYLSRFTQNDPSMLADCAVSLISCDASEVQTILDSTDIIERLTLAISLVKKEISVAKIQRNIKREVDKPLSEAQKKIVLEAQLQEIKNELGIKGDSPREELDKLFAKIKDRNLPPEVKTRFDEEIARLKMLEPHSPEYGTIYNYLTWLTDVPWGVYKETNQNFKNAKKILEEDHEGLKDVKERILEFLAVNFYKKDFTGSILLLVGPPGVGKTSIGKSIAHALDLPFYRFSVGGLSDEHEIKGHRRTYISSMPGKFVQALKECKVMNPVIMIDEIDKIYANNFGDPSSALLETLDPEQNKNFLDHYLDIGIDLSKCLFICTANTIDTIPEPLYDRMDSITLSGYLAEEKFKIAKKHLIPKSLAKAGIKNEEVVFTTPALKQIIEEYARDAGVRQLEKSINKIVRKGVVQLLENPYTSIEIQPKDLRELLGVAPFSREKTLAGVGIITGLAWTSAGGCTLPVEASLIDTTEAGFKLTGNLGDVMKESATIALSYVKSHLALLAPKVSADYFEKAMLHLHVPEGAIPKDGPSAGVTMASAILSLVLQKAPKKGFAMTGELSLTGAVLAIGGIREKVTAAKRVGIKNIIVPEANRGDVEELPDFVSKNVKFFYADTYAQVAQILFA